MRELSIFVDESGSDGLSDRHYLLTVVMHDQSDSIADSIEACDDTQLGQRCSLLRNPTETQRR